MASGKRPLYLLLSFAALLAALIAWRLPLSIPIYGYYYEILEWAHNGFIADTFTPLAYPLYGGIAYRAGGIHAVLLAQALITVLIAWAGYSLLRYLGLPPLWSALGAIPALLHPDILTSVSKIWDVSLSVVTLLLIVVTFVPLVKNRPTWLQLIIAGVALGAGMAVRPNYEFFAAAFVVLAFTAWTGPPARRAASIAVAFATTALTFTLVNIAAHGSYFFPRNGPYNLYAGHNPHTAQVLLERENAEISILIAYRDATGIFLLPPGGYYAAELEPFYTHSAIEFALHHPAEEVRITALKLFTLLRPDTKVHPLLSPAGLVKGIFALPVTLVLALLLGPPRPQLTPAAKFLLLLDVLYILPFLITNSDPRFRVPLDALLLLQAVHLLWLRHAAATISAPHESLSTALVSHDTV